MILRAGVKKTLNVQHICVYMSSGQVHLNFYLSCCHITLGIQGKMSLHCIFFTCPSYTGWKYMLVLIEILLVLGSRTSDFFFYSWSEYSTQWKWPTSSEGGRSSSEVASSSPPEDSDGRLWRRGLPLSSSVTIIGSMIDRAVSSSAAREHENTSKLCKLHDRGRSVKLGRYDNTAVLCITNI